MAEVAWWAKEAILLWRGDKKEQWFRTLSCQNYVPTLCIRQKVHGKFSCLTNFRAEAVEFPSEFRRGVRCKMALSSYAIQRVFFEGSERL